MIEDQLDQNLAKLDKVKQTDADTPMSFPAPKGRGEYIWTYTGRQFFFNDTDPDISILDIAHALANICRWTGHVKKFYSVAEHCVRCSLYPTMKWSEYQRIKEQGAQLVGTRVPFALRKLLHDAPEAYITDLNKPVKNVIGGASSPYEALDERITRAIWSKYGLLPMSDEEARAVKAADLALAMTEARDLLSKTSVAHYEGARPVPEAITPWSPDFAEEMFLERFKELM